LKYKCELENDLAASRSTQHAKLSTERNNYGKEIAKRWSTSRNRYV